MNFETLAQSIDITEFLLTELGVKIVGDSGNDIMIMCPNPYHNDTHPSCYFDRDKLIWHCFGCGERGSIIYLVEAFKGLSRGDAIKYLESLVGLKIDDVSTNFLRRHIFKDMPLFKLSSLFKNNWPQACNDIQDFISRRKFNLDLFNKYGIGFNNVEMSLTLPVYYKGQLINFGERYIDPNSVLKIKYQKGAPMSKCLWGIHDNDYDKHNPYFTEGIFDALRMIEAGYNAYALLTNQVGDDKFKFINDHFDGVFTFVPDNDNGGKLLIDYIKKFLHVTDIHVVDVAPYKDIDEIPIVDIKAIVDNSTPLQDILKKPVINKNIYSEVCNDFISR